MIDHNVNVLNSVTKTLIDSCNGYDACVEISGENYALKTEFLRRKSERHKLVQEFQNQVRELGGQPATGGSMAGAVHRGFTRFTSFFRDDETAAIAALDDGEEFLAEKIEDKLEYHDLSAQASDLLNKAMISAKSGERFADMMAS